MTLEKQMPIQFIDKIMIRSSEEKQNDLQNNLLGDGTLVFPTGMLCLFVRDLNAAVAAPPYFLPMLTFSTFKAHLYPIIQRVHTW